MTFKQAMAKLKALGTAQTRKTYVRHGADPENLFGVKYGDMAKLEKEIKVDHDLAMQLWASGYHDARVLATRIVDQDQVTAKLIDTWARQVKHRILSYDLANMVRRSKFAKAKTRQWIKAANEWVCCMGWQLVACAAETPDVTDGELEELLKKIEADIHSSKNMVRYGMNNALIGIGGRSAKLRRRAIAAAKRIGPIEVDHGNTDCKTPDAVPYIEKIWARKKK